MGHAEIENDSPFAVQPIFVTDQEARPLMVVVVKATLEFHRSVVRIADEQREVSVAGESYGDPIKSSYRYEPEIAFFKPTTDVVLIGHAHPSKQGERSVEVSLKVSDKVAKKVRVYGDRQWTTKLGVTTPSIPKPFEAIPLIYERAFGGWDSEQPDPFTSKFEPRNPIGTGFRQQQWQEDIALPNIEDPKHPIRAYGDTPPPAGFGFVSPNWQPRSFLAGTYDETWENERAPKFPTDFDVRFFNAASPGLIAPEYLLGDEAIEIENASKLGAIQLNLPGIAPPEIVVQLHGREDEHLSTNLDTVIINTDEHKIFLLWRCNLVLSMGPHDVIAIDVRTNTAGPTS